MPEPRPAPLAAKDLKLATDFLGKAANAHTAEGKLFNPAAPAPGEYTVSMRKGMSFAGDRAATAEMLNRVFAPATFKF